MTCISVYVSVCGGSNNQFFAFKNRSIFCGQTLKVCYCATHIILFDNYRGFNYHTINA